MSSPVWTHLPESRSLPAHVSNRLKAAVESSEDTGGCCVLQSRVQAA